jgi:hypothetical protein
MTQEEILEYNKRCAEFLGWDYNKFMDRWNENFHHEYSYVCSDDLKFHSDWNWIMEVKRHIVGLGYCWFQFPNIIQINENATISSFKIVKIEFDKLKEKEAVIQAINQFLILHNENR